jgi:hypothetical protein
MATAVPKSPTSTIQLATVGHPALAIIWKNMLCLRRTSQWRVFIGPGVMAIAIGTAMGGAETDAAARVAAGAMVLAGMLLLFGGRLIRNDLRHDMQHLPLIKSLPIASGHIVLAEIASSALPRHGAGGARDRRGVNTLVSSTILFRPTSGSRSSWRHPSPFSRSTPRWARFKMRRRCCSPVGCGLVPW